MKEIDYNKLFQEKWIELKSSLNITDAMKLNTVIGDFQSVCNAYKIKYGRLPELSHDEVDTLINSIENIINKLNVLKTVTTDRE